MTIGSSTYYHVGTFFISTVTKLGMHPHKYMVSKLGMAIEYFVRLIVSRKNLVTNFTKSDELISARDFQQNAVFK